MRPKFEESGVATLAASVDDLENASSVQSDLAFPVAYGVTKPDADSIGAWWEERRAIIQPSEFILDASGNVVSATYSTGPIGRLDPEDALKLIGFLESQKRKNN